VHWDTAPLTPALSPSDGERWIPSGFCGEVETSPFLESSAFCSKLLTGDEASGCEPTGAGTTDGGFMDGFMEKLLWAAVFDLVLIMDFRFSFLLITGGYRQEGLETIRPSTIYRFTDHVSSGTKLKIVLENRNHGIEGWETIRPFTMYRPTNPVTNGTKRKIV
jgi:hypothetical protein